MSSVGTLKGKRLAFVLPRFYEGIVGGAETLSGEIAARAKAHGADVEIWTTCAQDNRTWENHFTPGEDEVDGVPVKRFLIDERDLELWIPRQIQLSEGVPLSLEDQFIWMQESVNSSALYRHIHDAGEEFDLLLFGPYLFGTTFWGSLIHPDRSALIPCLHDEPNAYLEIVASMFRQVRGCFFNCAAEMDLARTLYGKGLAGGVVGMGFDQLEESISRDSYFKEEFPYILYLGRMETGKNVHLLIDYFIEAKESYRLAKNAKLVIAGGGSFSDLYRDEAEKREDILPVGRVSEEEKIQLMANATALVQPSTNESFCIVIMEGWRVETPALVHEKCPVTKDHVVNSTGGLYFKNGADLAGTFQYLIDSPEQKKLLGANGKRYVASEYDWDEVIKRFCTVLGDLLNKNPPLHILREYVKNKYL